MEDSQFFFVARIFESRDMSVGHRDTDCEYARVSNITKDEVFMFYERPLTVISIDENEMVFTYLDKTYRLNREWQVLGTPWRDISNMYVNKMERFVFYFGANHQENWNWDDEYNELLDLFDEICDNADNGNQWKNTPLARRLMSLIKNLSPVRDDDINPALRAYMIEVFFKRDAISVKETPRLYQSFCEYYRLCLYYAWRSDYNDELERDMDKYYFRTVDEYIYKLAWIVNSELSGHALEQWDSLSRHLKVDPVQASEKWEDVIYDVEKEVDEELKDDSRGMGFCHAYWSAKRAALARHGIEWRNPSSMNPRVMFD